MLDFQPAATVSLMQSTVGEQSKSARVRAVINGREGGHASSPSEICPQRNFCRVQLNILDKNLMIVR